MTLLRKLALQIADAVAYYAAPGTKDWVEATAREIAFIPGDWSALAWALGSTRVVFQRNPDPEAAPAEFNTLEGNLITVPVGDDLVGHGR